MYRQCITYFFRYIRTCVPVCWYACMLVLFAFNFIEVCSCRCADVTLHTCMSNRHSMSTNHHLYRHCSSPHAASNILIGLSTSCRCSSPLLCCCTPRQSFKVALTDFDSSVDQTSLNSDPQKYQKKHVTMGTAGYRAPEVSWSGGHGQLGRMCMQNCFVCTFKGCMK